ncbi:MAG: hypothetical protein ABIJ56_12055 [Pseudomonadota bacterium]
MRRFDKTAMTLPRRILPETTYFVFRRCTQRQFFLKPSPIVNQVFLYCLAVAAAITNVEVHAFIVMSNHWHAVLTDHDGRLPEFMEWLHKFVAKCLNVDLGRWENFWSNDRYSAIQLNDKADVLDKITYTLANPVNAGLVSRSRDWPGLRITPEHFTSGPIRIKRPSIFFRPNGKMPRRTCLDISVPPAFSGMSPRQFSNLIAIELHKREKLALQKLSEKGRHIMGRKKILAQSPNDSPSSNEQHRKLIPRVAAKNKWRRIEAVRRDKAFYNAYREAWRIFKTGDFDVVFPLGTYRLRQLAGDALDTS